jgi:hypothetical protein
VYGGKIERYPCMHIPPSWLTCLLAFEVNYKYLYRPLAGVYSPTKPPIINA